MSDIFVSYASKDREKVRPLIEALAARGWSVFWDRTIPPGTTWDEFIQAELDAARCVVVLWSETSAKSDFVKEEIEEAKSRKILVPAKIEEASIPLGYRRIQAANLSGWDGKSPNSEFDGFVKSIAKAIAKAVEDPGRVGSGAPSAAATAGSTEVEGRQESEVRSEQVATAPTPATPPKKRKPPEPYQLPEKLREQIEQLARKEKARVPKKAAAPLAEVIAATELKHTRLTDGTVAVPFAAERTKRVIVQARELKGDMHFFAVELPEPVRSSRDDVLHNLLRTTFAANYVKALSTQSDKLLFAAEVPTAVVTPAVAEGVIRGLVHLGDVTKKDLREWKDCEQRLRMCTVAQARHIKLDAQAAAREIEGLLDAAGLPKSRTRRGTLVTQLKLLGVELKVLIHISGQLISFVISLGGVKPTGDRSEYLAGLLTLNRAVNVAKVGIDNDGDVTLMYEVPAPFPGLLDQVKVTFGVLLLGVQAGRLGKIGRPP
jgi:hypothetical protein